jgi:diguanylate cyclase (GGDEF)-like protein
MRNLDAEILNRILKEKLITPVYQPIVSLLDGKVFGYEALSRVPNSKDSNKIVKLDIENLFRVADKINKSWEFETLCRNKTFEYAKDIVDTEKKLFINVNSNIIHDANFIGEFTKKHLDKCGMDSSNIVFEITERIAITDKNTFLESINHYRTQNYLIAIDDVGSGYSGLDAINNIKPDIIKLDLNLIRDIDKDITKQFLCKAMADFGNNAGIKVIAEGIETEEELRTLIKLDVGFGQGYFLGTPDKPIVEVDPGKVEMIKKYNAKKLVENTKSSIYSMIGPLSKQGCCYSPDEKAENIYETLKLNHSIIDFVVVENNAAVGFMTKLDLDELFSGRYGYSLYSKKNISEIMNHDFLKVDYKMPIDQASKLAMQRPVEQLYNPIVVVQKGKYEGIVTIRDLLEACTKIEIDMAKHSNPLTGLPGNLLIEKEIINRIFEKNPYCITYYDLDNFKAYNDAYGFQNGDLMLALVADTLKAQAAKGEFIGHIGGDDFIVICDYHEGEDLCKAIIDEFSQKVLSLYREEDVENGFIISKNRHGVREVFPLASLSIAGISNRAKTYNSLDEFSGDIAQIKKKCKRQEGNYYEIL